jgi:hypothetical protein
MTVRLRYRFPGPATVGARTRLPSGKVYHVPMFGRRTIDVDEVDVVPLLGFKGECCTGGKKPLFEREPES